MRVFSLLRTEHSVEGENGRTPKRNKTPEGHNALHGSFVSFPAHAVSLTRPKPAAQDFFNLLFLVKTPNCPFHSTEQEHFREAREQILQELVLEKFSWSRNRLQTWFYSSLGAVTSSIKENVFLYNEHEAIN